MTTDSTPILLLDVMNTLVQDPFYEHLPAALGISFEELMRDKHPSAWLEFERGEIGEQEFLDKFFRDGRRYDQSRLLEQMRAAYRFLPGMETLAMELKNSGNRLHLFSNYSSWYEMIEAELKLSRFASWSFVSCDLGLRKPEPEVFRHVIQSLDVPPQRLLLIDDRDVNCNAARNAGMQAILFENARQLRHLLKQRGIE